ncbi:hypothetical protein [Oceanobacillus sp. FSL H7-0719]|uniref:hypothetical protein n=1 Tax=Oceanobacillus sp. FSL H7-0719 TaxID=2954507 RepID=UPI003247054F
MVKVIYCNVCEEYSDLNEQILNDKQEEQHIHEDKEMITQHGEEHFKRPKEDFITLSKNMTASEYREWRETFRRQSIQETIAVNYESLNKLSEGITKEMRDLKFCYAKEGGQGYTHKSKCVCDKENILCQAGKDANKFHEACKDIKHDNVKHRNEIVKELKSQFKDSKWWKDNVIE